MADRIAHLSNLPRTAFLEGNEEQRLVRVSPAVGCGQADLCGPGRAPVDGNPLCQTSQIVRVGDTAHARLVDALDPVTRMHESRRQIAVVRQQQKSLGVVVEPANRIEIAWNAGDQVHHGGPLLGIVSCGDVAARLVQQNVAAPPTRPKSPAVHPHIVTSRVRARAQLGDRGSIHADAALQNEALGGPPRGDAGRRHELLQADTIGASTIRGGFRH